jgi:hypothetical protein
MENRIVIKKINFFEQLTNDIQIKLYHNKISQISDTIWEYENNGIINWKFIIDYEPDINIDFILLENNPIEDNNIIGHGFHKNDVSSIKKPINQLFPEPIINIVNIEKNNNLIAQIEIEQYIIAKEDNYLFKCGNGWELPDNYPKLNIFPFKNRNDIFQNIRIIEDSFSDDSQYDVYSEAFVRIINNIHNKPPICFGIIAPDNYGKSRLLQNLKNKINILPNSKSFVVIDFNPWNFESDDTIWASILMSIHDALENKFGKFNLKLLRIRKTLFPTTWSFIFFLLKIFIPITILLILYIYDYYSNKISSIILTLTLAISSLFFLKDGLVLIKNLFSSVSDVIYSKISKPDWKNKLGFMNEIKQEFFDFINPAIKEYNCRLILLIDDLDKCSIEKIYLVIKALSLLKYSDCPLYIFLSYDSVKINDAIKSYYKIKHLTTAYEGKHLLDKLITIPFCLPEKNIVENITLLDKYIKASSINVLLSTPTNISSRMLSKNSIDDITIIYLNEKGSPKNENLHDIKMNQMERNINNHTLTFFQLENYYKYLVKMEKEVPNNQKIKDIKKLVYKEFVQLKKDFTNNYYIGLDTTEINLFQNILEETKYSGNCLNNTQIIKIINMYSIARFLLPNYLKYKKDKLFHLLIITENWSSIIIEIYSEIRKNKINLSIDQVKECFDNKDLLFYYLNKDLFTKNDELIIYLSKFEIKITDFIDLEIYIINLDRCFNTIV